MNLFVEKNPVEKNVFVTKLPRFISYKEKIHIAFD